MTVVSMCHLNKTVSNILVTWIHAGIDFAKLATRDVLQKKKKQ